MIILIVLLLAIAALIAWTAYSHNWDWRATVAAIAAFLAAIWAAFGNLGVPTP